MFLGWCRFGVGVCGFLGCSRPAHISPFHPITNTTLFTIGLLDELVDKLLESGVHLSAGSCKVGCDHSGMTHWAWPISHDSLKVSWSVGISWGSPYRVLDEGCESGHDLSVLEAALGLDFGFSYIIGQRASLVLFSFLYSCIWVTCFFLFILFLLHSFILTPFSVPHTLNLMLMCSVTTKIWHRFNSALKNEWWTKWREKKWYVCFLFILSAKGILVHQVLWFESM